MALKVFWTDFARNELRNIHYYYLKNAGEKIADTLIDELIVASFKIEPFIEKFQLEELLKSYPENIRYFVHKNYKLFYFWNSHKEHIEIIDVFDTRQNPEKIKRSK